MRRKERGKPRLGPGRGWMLNKAPFRLRWGRWGPEPVAGCVCREGTGIH